MSAIAPAFGCIALCSQGERGLITSSAPVEVKYEDGTTGMAWTGFHISPDRIGQPWSSRNPRVIQQTSTKTRKIMEYLIQRARKLKRME